MSNVFDPEKASIVLLSAVFTSDDKAAAEFGVAKRTIQHWRVRLQQDPEFARIFAKKKKEFNDKWADRIPGALSDCLAFIQRATETLDARNPAALYNVVGAFKVVAEVDMARRYLLDDRDGDKTATAEGVFGSPSTEANELPN